MNFEIIDNVFQVAVFFAAALGDMVYWFYKRDRLYIILALVHSCFMMGTHTYQIVRYRIKKIRIAKIPVI